MPPLVAAVLIGAGLYAGVKVARELDRLMKSRASPTAGVKASDDGTTPPGPDLGTFERDPETGVFRAPPKGD